MTSHETDSHCPYCALQCGMKLVVENDSVVVKARPDFPTNKGGLCRKGWTAAELLRSPERLTTPLMRRNRSEALQPVSWETALEYAVSRIADTQNRYGRDAVGLFGGGGLTNEKAYSLGKFARVALRTSNIDYNGRYCMSSAATAGIKAFGLDRGLPFPLEDIPHAEAILIAGGNMAETMPPIMQYFNEQQTRGGKLIVADPRKTPTAASADIHLQLTPGTDAALANGLLHIAATDGLIDHDFIASRTDGYENVRRIIASYWPDRVERITGVPIKLLTQAAHLLGEAATAMVLTARGTEQQSKGVDNTLAFINLILALGKAGKPYCGYGCVTGQGNGQGGREHGLKADQLPGYRKIDNPEHRAAIAKVWGIEVNDLPGPGRSAYEMLESIGSDNSIRALLVMGSNIVVSSPHANRVADRLNTLDFLMVNDIFLSETAAMADVVFPVTQWAEEDGTMTNLEGRVLRRRSSCVPPDGVRSDLYVIKALAEYLGYGSFFSDDPATVFNELRKASSGGTADYAGIDYERIDNENGVFWPCPDESHPGTPRLFLDRFATSDGRARFHPVMHRPPAEEPDDDYPLYLTTGRVMGQYQSGTQTRRVGDLNDSFPHAFVEIHPVLARQFGILDGETVVVSTRRGDCHVAARLTTSIRQDTLFIPFHWPGCESVNRLTNPALDPYSRMPEFKICAAKILPFRNGTETLDG